MQETGTLWIHSVPKEVVDSVDEREMRRQEAINELIYTERDFVRDMEYLRDVSSAELVRYPSSDELRACIRLALDQTIAYERSDTSSQAGIFRNAGFLEYS